MLPSRHGSYQLESLRLVLDAGEADGVRRKRGSSVLIPFEHVEQESGREVIHQVMCAIHIPDRVGADPVEAIIAHPRTIAAFPIIDIVSGTLESDQRLVRAA